MKNKFKIVEGMLWPAYDTQLLRCNHIVTDITVPLAFIKEKRTVFQAGGACGIWAKELAKQFNQVFTFEPDPLNFTCLCHNIRGFDEKIIRIQAALGDKHQPIGLHQGKRADNAGAQHADPDMDGFIPMLKIDDFIVHNVDLIILDIEGWEAAAINGAERTIKECHPIIMIEAKPLIQMKKLGTDEHKAGNILISWGYKKITRIHRDDIYAYPDTIR